MAADASARELRMRLDDARAAIARRWPEAPSDLRAFEAHVAARLAGQADPAAALAKLHLEDVFLAWWAASGAAPALVAFEAEHGGELARIAARFPSLAADDLRQQLRIKLFVGEPGKPAKILDYGGAGSLLAWLRVVAVRAGVDATRSVRSQRAHDELDEAELLGLPLVGELRQRPVGGELLAALKRAFADAVASLAPRQRAVLRHAYVDQLTLEQIAASYAIHRATVARILAGAREQLVDHTRRAVIAALGVAPSELASAIGTLDKRLDLSLSRVLRSA